ncbi:MAG: hypothetical protein NT003_03200 [Candidatus Magasanikbacteria bacterium]|nr:hypothetical protein [Candidatus Magasanikbacteria bacterium]
MKLISLNTFGGRVFEPLMEWVQREAATTDIFCFQEILDGRHGIENERGWRSNLLEELTAVLPEFNVFFKPTRTQLFECHNVSDRIAFGKAMFVKKGFSVEKMGDVFVWGSPNDYEVQDNLSKPNSFLYTQLVIDGAPLMICNMHGMPFPGDKFDTPERIAQSQKILDFFAHQSGEKIICGDFNLLPETESVKMFERAGYKDLVKDFKIVSTRGTLCKELHPEFVFRQEYADFTFVSPGISVKKFEVPDAPISDHLPMILEF